MNRRVALLASTAALASTPACVMSNGARTATIVAGLGSIALGVVAGDGAAVDADGDGHNDTSLDDDLGQQAVGGVLIIGGMIGVIAGIASHEPTPSAPPPPEPFPPVGARALPAGRVSDNVLRLARQVRRLAARHECAAVRTLLTRISVEDPGYAAELRVAMPCR